MSLESMSEAVRALNEGDWSRYQILIRSAGELPEDQVWEWLAEQHPSVIDLWAVLARLPGDRAGAACRWLLPAFGALPTISLTQAGALLSFVDIVPASFQYAVVQALRPHLSRQPSLGKGLGEALKGDGTVTERVRRAWAAAFMESAPYEAGAYAATLMTGAPSDTGLLTRLLQFLPGDPGEIAPALRDREVMLADWLLSIAPGDAGGDAWRALGGMTHFSPTALSHLRSAMEDGVPQAAIVLATNLFQLNESSVGVGAEPLRMTVSGLIRAGMREATTRDHIDDAIASLAHRDGFRGEAVAALIDIESGESNVVELFPKSFEALGHHHHDFTRLLTEWLLDTNASFGSLQSMLSMCGGHRAPVELDVVAFSAQTTDRRVKAARRLVAMTHHGPTLCQFAQAIAEMDALTEERFVLAAQMLRMAFDEYPDATASFLKDRTRGTSHNDPAARVFRSVYAEALRWRRVLAQLPARKELRPAEMELHALRSLRTRFGREVTRMAEERSLFRTIVSTVHIAQGRRFASHGMSGPPQLAEMGMSSHSVELPSSELADPMRGLIARESLLQGAR